MAESVSRITTQLSMGDALTRSRTRDRHKRMFAMEKELLMAKLNSFFGANLSAMDESGTCLEQCLCA